MIRHVVMWNVRGASRDEKLANIEKLKAAFQSLRGRIPGLLHLEIGVDTSCVDYACDVVLVSDATMLARLAEMPASKWFAARDDLVSTFPKGLRYRGWELVPGQHLRVSGDVFRGSSVAGAFVFASYQDPGAHRVRVEHFSGHMVVQLDSNNLTVVESK